jgi:L-cysteine desulfidase
MCVDLHKNYITMRTAEEILREIYNENDSQEDNLQLAITLNPSLERIIKAINEARIEAIKECAEAAKSEWVRWGEHMGHQVEKQSILKLIDQVK